MPSKSPLSKQSIEGKHPHHESEFFNLDNDGTSQFTYNVNQKPVQPVVMQQNSEMKFEYDHTGI